MSDRLSPYSGCSAAQADAVTLLAMLLARFPHLPALHWSVTTRGDRLIGTSLGDDPSLQRAETRAWAKAIGVSMTEDQTSDTTYLWGEAVLHGVRLILHTMIIIPPDEDSERLLARIFGDQWPS
jgi:hypothetical protein